MSSLSYKTTVVAFAVGSALAASSQVFAETTEEKDIEVVEVWSTQVKASSLYLKGEEIANKQADHISDLLRTIPGVDVGGAHSLNQRITIRSMDDKDLAISIDGAQQNTYMYHHMGNLQIHADILKSVDIEVGSNSVINSGLGGSVRFETKQAKELLADGQTLGARIQVGASDNANNNFSLTGYGLLTDNLDFLVYYNFVDRQNYEVGGGKILNADGSVVAGTDGEVRGLEGELTDALIKFGWDIDANQRVQVSYENYVDEGDYSYRPDMGLATDIAITESLAVPLLWPTEFTRDTVTLNYELVTGVTMVKAAIYSNTSELFRDESGYAANPAFAGWAGLVTGEATNTGANLIAETSMSGAFEHELTYGFDYVKHDTKYQGVYPNGTQISEESANNLALYVQDRIAFNQQLTFIPGARYDRYDIDSAVVDDSFSELSLAAALEFQASDDLLFKLSGTQLFKGPEIGEVFVGAGSNDTANSTIEAETGLNIEFAFAYQVELNRSTNLSLGATVFNTQINDYIYDYAPAPADSGARYWKDNIGDMTIDGFEAYVGVTQGNFSANLTLSNAESELDAFSQYASLNGARLDRQQGDTISANVNYELEQLGLTLNWEALRADDVDAGLDLDGASLNNAKDAYTVHNISAKWAVQQVAGLAVIVGVDNLFDEFYASQSSRTGVSFHPRFGELYLQDFEPGRNVKATVSYAF